MKLTAPVIALSATLLLAGCASQTPTPSEYSGFLSDYSQLQPAQSASGAPVMRWVSPDFKPENYRSVLVERPLFYPAPTPDAQVSQQTLDEIALYLQQAMRLELAGRMRVVEHPDTDTLVLRSAITAVNLSPEGLKLAALLAVGALAAAFTTSTGPTARTVVIEGIGEYAGAEAPGARLPGPTPGSGTVTTQGDSCGLPSPCPWSSPWPWSSW